MASPIADSIKEIEVVKKECLGLLADLRLFHPLPPGTTNYPDTYRLLVIPILYAAWQRCFTLCNAIAWRRLRDEAPNAAALTEGQRAVWLLQAGFYASFTGKLLNAAAIGSNREKPKRFHQPALSEFLGNLDQWTVSGLDLAVDTEKLVMTFSNVNPEVVEHNAKVLGIHNDPAFQAIRFAKLNSLVRFRNDIGHGGTLKAPPNDEFNRLWPFTEKLIDDYSEAFKQWLISRFPPPPPPLTFIETLVVKAARIIKAAKSEL